MVVMQKLYRSLEHADIVNLIGQVNVLAVEQTISAAMVGARDDQIV